MALGNGRSVVMAALLLAACGGQEAGFFVHDTAIVVRSDAAFVQQPDFRARVEETVDAALLYWGGSWDDLAGVTVTFTGSRYVDCGSSSAAAGCYDGDIRVSTGDSGVTYGCVEATTLVHEVGHAVLGDPRHTDPRWLDFASVGRALAGRRGYGSGDDPCSIHVSVWRHPPGSGGAH
jgi:hypothetical protein